MWKTWDFGLDYSHRLLSIKCSGQLPIWLVWTQPSGGRRAPWCTGESPVHYLLYFVKEEQNAQTLQLLCSDRAQEVLPNGRALLTPLGLIPSLVFRGWGSETLGRWSRKLRLLGVCLISEPCCLLQSWSGFYLNSFLLRSLDFQEKHLFRSQRSSGGRKLWDNWWSLIASETSRNHLVAC